MFSTCDNLKSISLGLLAEMPFRVSRGIVAERAKGFSTSAIMKITEKDKGKFWINVNKRERSQCWDWVGAITKRKYGTISLSGMQHLAHRLSYLIHFGKIPKGLFVLHKCDNPNCVNPFHLEVGTQKKNMQDCVDRGRHHTAESYNHGEECPWSKLTDAKVIAIRKLHSDGVICAELARRFNSSDSNIRDVCKRRTWKHIVNTA